MSLNNGYPMFYITKCSREDNLESQLHSPIISRLDEMYLNRAEAYVKKGNIEEARRDVNEIRTRAIKMIRLPTMKVHSLLTLPN